MSTPLIPSADLCCAPCEEPTTTLVPGPQGDPGTDGTDGTDGIDAFTTASSFTMPAELANVTVTVGNSEWMAPGQVVWARGGGVQGAFEVQSTPTITSVILKNLEDTASELYPENSAPGAIFPNGTLIVASGRQGAAGTDGSSGAPDDAAYIVQTPNAGLSAEQALSLLGTGLLKNTTGTGVLSIGVAETDYLSPAAIGVTVQEFGANLEAIKNLVTAGDKLDYWTGSGTAALADLTAFIRTLLDDATAAAARTTLRALAVNQGALVYATGINLNSSGDNALTISQAASGYIIESIIVFNASTSLTTATAGVFTAAGGGGTPIAADQALSALTSAAKFTAITLEAIAGTDWRTDGTLYFRVGTPQGSAATASVAIFGKILSA